MDDINREIEEYLEWLDQLRVDELRTEIRPYFDNTEIMNAFLDEGRDSAQEYAAETRYKGRHRA